MLTQPTLLLDKAKCLSNIERMAQKALKANVTFRPHFKTHQSAEVGSWFRAYGVDCITVSSVKMALYFANNGWTDITIAFPANILEWSTINELAAKINLNIVVESAETIHYLEKQLTNPVGTYIKTDTGYGRTGVAAEDYGTMQQLLKELKSCKNLIFIGFLCHAGHTYNTQSRDEILTIMESSRQQLLALKTFMSNDFPLIQLSYGDTPSCSVSDNFEGFDEIRPGNCVFYDDMQTRIGSCHQDDIAVALACPVVAKHPERLEVIVHGGAVHLSKDVMSINNQPHFGTVLPLMENKWLVNQPLGYVAKLSQEHGIIKMPQQAFDKVKIGDMLAVLPVHSCLTANLMKAYQSTDGSVISMMV
ncbi:alanine racemase [Carboxylicivirga sediminis]|uniref:Alanine racemase n=1 Tax=Carboxylicivirga sediminis TaxID=2006564 RepID=A0A941F794_9BACT|nr:alanine racemase [Carboxylicivirga sediminis]MBR8537752.1 alanine racemase [Carboxylicivirga sediminis]